MPCDDDNEADLCCLPDGSPRLLGNWHKIKGNLQLAVM